MSHFATTTINCLYRNETAGMQIVRIDDEPDFTLERLVMPGQCLWFEAPATAALQIHSYRAVSTTWEDTIPCQQLRHPIDAPVLSLAKRAYAIAA
jgi:hypothetical protein